MTDLDLSIVIVSWNVCSHLRACLQALPAAVGTARNYEVIVVDNASVDGTAAMLRREFPGVRLIANERNHLYTAAANQGLGAARGRHRLLLNPDALPQSGSLATLISVAETRLAAGLLGPRILDSGGHDDLRTGRHYPTVCSEWLDWLGLSRRFPHSRLWAANLRPGYDRSRTAAVPLLSGACLLLPAQLPPALARLDERYPMYGEDLDLCRRVQAAGYETVLVAGSVIHHEGGASSRQANAHTAVLAVAGANRYLHQWQGPGQARLHRLGMALIAGGKWLAFALAAAITRRSDPVRRRRTQAAILAWAMVGNRD